MDYSSYKLNNSLIRNEAKAALRGKWLLTNLSLVSLIIVTATVLTMLSRISFVGHILTFIISTPLNLGGIYLAFTILNDDDYEPKVLFSGFSNIWNILSCSILTSVYLALWVLAFTSPFILLTLSGTLGLFSLIVGIAYIVIFTKGMMYSQSLYIIIENPECGPNEAITKSKQLMKGHKLDYFFMTSYLTLINVLCAITIVGLFYSLPYTLVSLTNFYKHLKKSNY